MSKAHFPRDTVQSRLPDPEWLERWLDEQIRFDKDCEARVIGGILRNPQVWLLADDIYEHILYDGRAFATPAAVLPSLRDRTLTVNGVSKSYAMTGWRLGYGAGPKALIAAMAVVQSQATSCPSSISQAAAVAALTGLLGNRRYDPSRPDEARAIDAAARVGTKR